MARRNISLVDGYRRLEAVLEANVRGAEIVSIPAIIQKNLSDIEALAMQILANDGLPLQPLEEAAIYKQFLDWGWTQVEIAKRFGKHEGIISQRLLLLEASPELRTALKDGDVKQSEAVKMIRRKRSGEEEGGIKKLTKRQAHIERVRSQIAWYKNSGVKFGNNSDFAQAYTSQNGAIDAFEMGKVVGAAEVLNIDLTDDAVEE